MTVRLVVIDARKKPWRLTRFEGREIADTAELLVPRNADSREVKEVIEQFRLAEKEPADAVVS